MQTNPDLNYASVSSRLREQWTEVSSKEKLNFKRKARLANSRIKMHPASDSEIVKPIETVWLASNY